MITLVTGSDVNAFKDAIRSVHQFKSGGLVGGANTGDKSVPNGFFGATSSGKLGDSGG